jgi:hypothetical protein
MDITRTKFESLVAEASALSNKHKDIARATGEKFNIFSILRVESKETSTHSAFLVELLDPDGSHGQGRVFLNLFVTTLLVEALPQNKFLELKFDARSATVYKEKYVGKINEEWTEGGQLDILIKDNLNNAICIENKIYAEDQNNQLIRYSNYLKKHHSKGVLLYLARYESEASSKSTEYKGKTLKVNEDYFTISYQKHILDWLESCQKATNELPIIREAIGQYIQLIKKLTGQSMSQIQKKELRKLIAGNDKFDDFVELNMAFRNILSEIKNRLKQLDGKLKLEKYQKTTKIWTTEDQLSKLNSVLFVELNPIDEAKSVELKIRLSPKGWTIEFWKIEGLSETLKRLLSDGTEQFDPGMKKTVYKTMKYETGIKEVKETVEKIVGKLYNQD